MSGFGERLREELGGKNVSEVARALGVARNTIYNWADKGNAPLGLFAQLMEHGVDLGYVLTGVRSIERPGMQQSEIDLFNEIVDTFWNLSDESRETAAHLLSALSLKDITAGTARGVRGRPMNAQTDAFLKRQAAEAEQAPSVARARKAR